MKKIILTILSIIFLQTNVFSFPISAVAFKKCNSHLLITVNECKVKQKYSKEIKEPEIRPTNEYYLNSVEQNISLFADIDLMSVSNTVSGIVAKIVSGTKATEAIREQANINLAESYSNVENPQGKLADLVFSNSLVESANRDLDNGRYITGTIKGLIATTQTALIFTGLGESVAGIRTVAGTSGYNAVATKATTIAENITTKEIANTVGKVEYKTVKNIKIPTLIEGSQKERNVYNSFASGKFEVITYGENTKLYRIADRNGNFWSLDTPTKTEYEWRINYAIKQEFNNNASNLYIITIPKDSSIIGLSGTVGSQGLGLYGGANQVYLDFKEIPQDWIKTIPMKWRY